MRIQLAIDDMTLADALVLCREAADHVDVIEIGTPLLLAEGMHAVRAVRAALPHHEVLADTKIVDAGAYESAMAFDAGADYCTVLGVTDDSTIRACLDVAAQRGKAVFVDLICVEDVAERTRTLEALGARGIAVHTGVDRQARGITPFAEFLQVKRVSASSTISVAGGISGTTAASYRDAQADIIVVGAGITRAPDRVAAARAIADIAGR